MSQFTSGNDWLDQLPEKPCQERDEMTLSAIEFGLAKFNWVPITSTIPGHTATFYVFDDSARVELDDGSRFRFQVTAKMTQQAADLLDASMVTAKIMDLSYEQADLQLDATILTAGPQMSDTSYSKKFNEKLESKRNGKEGLIRDVGKAWVLDNKLDKKGFAANYGFYYKQAPYFNPTGKIRMYQGGPGVAHDPSHKDYSQTLFLMQKTCELDGQQANIEDLMKDKDLCGLITYNGVLRYTRQPGV